MKRLLLPTIFLGFIFTSQGSENTTLRFEQLWGPQKAKDFSLGLDYDLNDESSIYLDYYQSQDNGTSRTGSLGGDKVLSDLHTINGEISYSKDQDDLQGLGIDSGLDLALSELWGNEKATDLGFNLGLTHYSNEEKISSTTTDETKYYQLRLGTDVEQELNSIIALSIGFKKYFYKDSSETITQINRNRTSSTPFSATDSSTDKKITLGMRLHQEKWPSLSYHFSIIDYKDNSRTKEHDVTASYHLKNWKFTFVYQNIKPENSSVEHWLGPRVSYKF